MEILKIIFEHDMTLEHLSGHDEDPRKRTVDPEQALASFLTPQKTYNRYYFTGTNLDENRFGLSAIQAWPVVREMIERALFETIFDRPVKPSAGRSAETPSDRPVKSSAGRSAETPSDRPAETPSDRPVKPSPGRSAETRSDRPAGSPAEQSDESARAGRRWHRPDGAQYNTFSEALYGLKPYDVLISGDTSDQHIRSGLILDDRTGIRERFEPLTALLDRGHLVILAEKAHHGFDLHLFCRDNLYEPLFNGCKDIIDPTLRCFTINGKRVSSERHFYFETWSLDRPPHGFQEVTRDARIR